MSGTCRQPARSRGLSLIEVVIFVVILGTGFAALLVVFNQVTTASVHPMVRKQALAIATSLMEEIQLRAFTYCDPDDANVFTAAGTGGCTTVEAIGPESETRYAEPRFDNVNDYQGFSMSGAGMRDVANNPISGLDAYSVAVTVANIAGGELADVADVNDALKIMVTVSGPAGVSVQLQGYRLRYAPNTP